MTIYNDLNETDKAIVQNTVNLLRAAGGEVARTWNHIIAIAHDTNAVGLVVGLDAGQVIPNTSGLAGADDLTKEEVADVFNLLDGIRQLNDTPENRALLSKSAGINAILG